VSQKFNGSEKAAEILSYFRQFSRHVLGTQESDALQYDLAPTTHLIWYGPNVRLIKNKGDQSVPVSPKLINGDASSSCSTNSSKSW